MAEKVLSRKAGGQAARFDTAQIAAEARQAALKEGKSPEEAQRASIAAALAAAQKLPTATPSGGTATPAAQDIDAERMALQRRYLEAIINVGAGQPDQLDMGRLLDAALVVRGSFYAFPEWLALRSAAGK
jgi:hypothetical protein